jgi:signal transduction histidine kinase
VARGNDTIEAQRRALSKRVAQLSDLLTQNEQLRDRVQRASQLATEGNERFLRRLGSDLHDGPAQLISYSLLQLNTLKPIAKCELDATSFHERLHAIRSALTDAMAEVRNICAGLTLPEIETRPFADVLMFVIREHERRTRTVVTFAASDLPAEVPQFVKICLCRFIQEGLNNAFRHADGKGQRVMIKTGRNSILVEVVDQGPGIKIHDRPSDRVCLGLPGLRDRIESLGGTLQIDSQPGIGTRLIAQLPVVTGGQ